MGLLDFLATGTSLKGLVGKRAHREVTLEAEVPNFGLKPSVAERLRDALDMRRKEDPFATGRKDVQERDIRERLKQHKGPRIRSTYKPDVQPAPPMEPPEPKPLRTYRFEPQQPQAERHLEQRWEQSPPSPVVEEPSAAEAGPLSKSNFVRKLKMARRVVDRPRGGVREIKKIKRQPKRPAFYRGATGARQRRSPDWMAA